MSQWNSQFNSRWKREFRRLLAERFNSREWEFVRCSKCKRRADVTKDRIMEIHHVNSHSEFPELALEIDNVIPLCNFCHKRFHREYDIRNGRFVEKVGTAEDLQIFLNLKANHILQRIE